MSALLATLMLGELLVEQSSGRHVPWPMLSVSLGVPTSLGQGRVLGVAELGAYLAWEQSALLSWQGVGVRPAGLLQYRVGTGRIHADVGAGAGAEVRMMRWVAPDYGWSVAVTPGLRLQTGLLLGEQKVQFRAQSGLLIGLYTLDVELLVGVAL